MKWENLAIGIIVVVIASGVFATIMYFGIDEYNTEGIITDKYILPRFNGEPIYYFVIDNKSDVKTFESCYYEYEIGDYYKPFS